MNREQLMSAYELCVLSFGLVIVSVIFLWLIVGSGFQAQAQAQTPDCVCLETP